MRHCPFGIRMLVLRAAYCLVTAARGIFTGQGGHHLVMTTNPAANRLPNPSSTVMQAS